MSASHAGPKPNLDPDPAPCARPRKGLPVLTAFPNHSPKHTEETEVLGPRNPGIREGFPHTVRRQKPEGGGFLSRQQGLGAPGSITTHQ